MTQYRVKFYKDLLSSDGHPFKCLQRIVEIRHARSADRALKAAQCRYERLTKTPSWKLYADTAETENAEGSAERRARA